MYEFSVFVTNRTALCSIKREEMSNFTDNQSYDFDQIVLFMDDCFTCEVKTDFQPYKTTNVVLSIK